MKEQGSSPVVEIHRHGPRHRYEVALAARPAVGLEQLVELVGHWGGTWHAGGATGGRMVLPVRAGMRYGRVEGEVNARAEGDGCRLSFETIQSAYRVRYTLFGFLVLGGFGGVIILAAPFAPHLLPLVPAGASVSIAAWMLIASRLETSGPEEFLGQLSQELAVAE